MAKQQTTKELEKAESPLWLQLSAQWLLAEPKDTLQLTKVVVEDRSWED